ncbi:MAG TPA: hypothetical protein VFO38_02880 [Candidatus Saccharimonadales bacterium]|nr:hypothetical protein [Candidatus Saccharimonadales bacterium]
MSKQLFATLGDKASDRIYAFNAALNSSITANNMDSMTATAIAVDAMETTSGTEKFFKHLLQLRHKVHTTLHDHGTCFDRLQEFWRLYSVADELGLMEVRDDIARLRDQFVRVHAVCFSPDDKEDPQAGSPQHHAPQAEPDMITRFVAGYLATTAEQLKVAAALVGFVCVIGTALARLAKRPR